MPEASARFDTAPQLDDSLLAIIRAALDGVDQQYQLIDDRSLHLTVRKDRAVYSIFFTADDETDFVRIVGSYGSNVPEDRRAAIAEAAARVNTRIGLGNFEIDFADGELRFRISADLEDGVLSHAMVDNMLNLTLHTLEHFHMALMRVAFADVSPEEAITAVP